MFFLMQDLIEAYEAKLDGEKEAYQQLKKDKEQSYLDFAEVRRQHEFDQDQELEEIKARQYIIPKEVCIFYLKKLMFFLRTYMQTFRHIVYNY